MKMKGKGQYEVNKATIKALRAKNRKLHLECEKYQAREHELDKALAKAETENKSLIKELHDAAMHIDEVFEASVDLEAAKTKLTRIQRQRTDTTIKNLRTANKRLQLECEKYQARAHELSEKHEERDEALAGDERPMDNR
jgi:chromosome segregation ATPase